MKKLLSTLAFVCAVSFSVNAQVTEDEALYLMSGEYDEATLDAMKADSPAEYDKLLYYYMDSWYVVEGDTPSTEYLNDKILITRFEDQRSATEEVEIVISAEGAKLVLKSQAEVDAKYAEIEAEY